MDTSRPYKNKSLEQKKNRLLARQRADEVLSQSKQRQSQPLLEIDRALNGEAGGSLSRFLLPLFAHINREWRTSFAHLLRIVAQKRSRLIENATYLRRLKSIARRPGLMIRPAESWNIASHNADRQYESLVRHLFALYPMPRWFDSAWEDWDPLHRRWQRWYAMVAQGSSLRLAEDMPVALTKRMVHHVMLAPSQYNVHQAIRWGQLRGLGCTPRIATAVILSQLETPAQDEPFWITVFQLLANSPTLDPSRVGPIIDYIIDRRFTQHQQAIVNGEWEYFVVIEPNFSVKGRTLASLHRLAEQWHAGLARMPKGFVDFSWPSCGVPGMDRTEGTGPAGRTFVVRELTDAVELYNEGQALQHCVGSYAYHCKSGRTAIYSLSVFEGESSRRLVTIELALSEKQVVQIRGKRNRPMKPLEERVIRAWAVQNGVEIAEGIVMD